jgi:DNA-binding NarL/FixJ family response regulator
MCSVRVLMLETPLFSHHVGRAMQIAPADIQVVGVANTAHEVIEMIPTRKPDVIIVNLSTASQDSFRSLRMIRSAYPTTRIIGRTNDQDKIFILRSVEAGVMGFVHTTASQDQWLQAIHTVRQGYPFLPTRFVNQFVASLRH